MSCGRVKFAAVWRGLVVVDESMKADDQSRVDQHADSASSVSSEMAEKPAMPPADEGAGRASTAEAPSNPAGGDTPRSDRKTAPEEFQQVEILPEDLADDPDEVEDDEFVGHAEPIEEVEIEAETAPAEAMEWFILKVQSNREKSICDALRRRVSVQGLDEYFGEILVPTEDVAEFKNGKRRVVKRKLYPGYIVANMVLNDETWFLVRETPGIGDFTGAAGKPTPMLPEEVESDRQGGQSGRRRYRTDQDGDSIQVG